MDKPIRYALHGFVVDGVFEVSYERINGWLRSDYERHHEFPALETFLARPQEDRGEALREALALSPRAGPEETVKALEDAAWGSRMDGGCHSRTSEILTTWAKEIRRALLDTGGEG